MLKVEAEKDASLSKIPSTAKSLQLFLTRVDWGGVMLLGYNVDRGDDLLGNLRYEGYTELPDAIDVVAECERRLKRRKGYPSRLYRERFKSCRGLVNDLAIAVSSNETILNDYTDVEHVFPGEEQVYDTVFKFYELFLKTLKGEKENFLEMMKRAKVLATQPGYKLSPIQRYCASPFLSHDIQVAGLLRTRNRV